MKIMIKEKGRIKFFIYFPLSARIFRFIARHADKSGNFNSISRDLINQSVSLLKQFKKHNGKMIIVHVETKDGDEVLIRL